MQMMQKYIDRTVNNKQRL